MTRNRDGQRIVRARRGDGTGAVRQREPFRELRVRARLAGRDLAERRPDAPLKRRAADVERELEGRRSIHDLDHASQAFADFTVALRERRSREAAAEGPRPAPRPVSPSSIAQMPRGVVAASTRPSEHAAVAYAIRSPSPPRRNDDGVMPSGAASNARLGEPNPGIVRCRRDGRSTRERVAKPFVAQRAAIRTGRHAGRLSKRSLEVEAAEAERPCDVVERDLRTLEEGARLRDRRAQRGVRHVVRRAAFARAEARRARRRDVVEEHDIATQRRP